MKITMNNPRILGATDPSAIGGAVRILLSGIDPKLSQDHQLRHASGMSAFLWRKYGADCLSLLREMESE